MVRLSFALQAAVATAVCLCINTTVASPTSSGEEATKAGEHKERDWKSGEALRFDPVGPADKPGRCGYLGKNEESLIAVDTLIFEGSCNKSIVIEYKNFTRTGRVVDVCAGQCGPSDLLVSDGLWDALHANFDASSIPIKWHWAHRKH